MCSSLDGLHNRETTSTNAIADQGISSWPLGIVASRKSFNPESPNHFQGQPRAAGVATVFYANTCRAHFHPLRLDFLKQFLLSMDRSPLCRLLNAQSPFFIELPQVSHHTLPWSAIGAL